MVNPSRVSHCAASVSPPDPTSSFDNNLKFNYFYNMKQDQKVFKLQGKVQHYAWGGATYLPQLLHLSNPDGLPFAEYWLGAHDNAPAEIDAGPLNEVIRKDARETLGAY